MADSLAVFNEGRIAQIGTPQDIYDRPATRFVADFVGSSNVLPPDLTQALGGPARMGRRCAPRRRASPPPAALSGPVTALRYLGSGTRVVIASQRHRNRRHGPRRPARPGRGRDDRHRLRPRCPAPDGRGLMRRALHKPRRGRCPLGLRPYPRDIWGQMKPPVHFICRSNIPAGGSDLSSQRSASGLVPQNSSFKNFDGPRARR